jgi:hypothetical protein
MLFILSLALTVLAQSQTSQYPTPPTRQQPGEVAPPDDNETRERMAHDMAKKANLERQAAIKTDTDKLLKLATELKEYVNKSNENVLSLDVIKKAEEIEKLARTVKEKMKGQN